MTEKKSRGRPKGSSDTSRKIRLKPSPKSAKEVYKKKYGAVGFTAIYGVDEFTEELVKYLWKDPHHEFIATDPVEQRLANLTRTIGNLPWSLYRWDVATHVGFIEEGFYPVVVVSENCWEEAVKLPNPHEVELICLSHWEK